MKINLPQNKNSIKPCVHKKTWTNLNGVKVAQEQHSSEKCEKNFSKTTEVCLWISCWYNRESNIQIDL
jgi:hypothetical protein